MNNRGKSIDELLITHSIEPVPFSNFSGTVKFIRLEELNDIQKAVINFSFKLFFRKDVIDNILKEEDKLKGNNTRYIPEYNFRRFAGGLNLPRSQYYTLCENSNGNDAGTLANELSAYVDYTETGEQQILDLSDPSTYNFFSRYFGHFFSDNYIPEKALAIIYYSRTGIPNPFHSYLYAVIKGETIQFSEVIRSFPILIPVNTKEITIKNVIDLRLPKTQQWFYENLIKGIPGLLFLYDNNDQGTLTPHLYINGKRPSGFFDLLPLLMTHFIGGTMITDVIAKWLISIGANGLIYPSARSDIYAEIINGTLNEFKGWCLVDYSNSQKPDNNEFNIIPHPDGWVQPYPDCILMMDPPSSRRNGSWRYTGCIKSRASIQQYNTELFYQHRYFKDKKDYFTKKYKLPEQNSTDLFSLAELVAALKSQQLTLTLNSLIETENNGPTQYDKLGKLIAISKSDVKDKDIKEIIISDKWFMYRPVSDHTYLLICPVCDWEANTEISILDTKKFCPNCYFGI